MSDDDELIMRASRVIAGCELCTSEKYCDRHELLGGLRDRLQEVRGASEEFERFKREELGYEDGMTYEEWEKQWKRRRRKKKS